MRFVWVDRGQNPAWSKLSQHKVTGVFLDIRDANAGRLSEIRANGMTPGVYAVWNHDEFAHLSGREFANDVASRYRSMRVHDLRLQYDIEAHDASYVHDCLDQSRKLLPGVGTSWTLEPNQASWFTWEMLRTIIETRTRVVPQLYNGPMSAIFDARAQCERLERYGLPEGAITPMYDLAHAPVDWDGYGFTQGRLP